ncbi:SDR family oxidoreductase [Vibrio profundum]
MTGASGFVGSELCSELVAREHEIRGIVRSISSVDLTSSYRNHLCAFENIKPDTNWSNVLLDIDCVVHCSARTHIMNETEIDALAAYRAVNVDGTRNLAEQAADAGVKRFIFISSIKVNGERTNSGTCFTSDDNAFPRDAYGISKWEAEQALQEISVRTDLEVVIIRPPLVYGPSVKGNFLSLLGWLHKGILLPLGAIHNQRSMVSISNLVDLIITCIDQPAAANQTFLVSDDEDRSTTELLRSMSTALGKPTRLLPVPSSMLKLGAQLLGKQDIAQRLLGNLQVDICYTKRVLDWSPPSSMDEGLRITAEWYLNQRQIVRSGP